MFCIVWLSHDLRSHLVRDHEPGELIDDLAVKKHGASVICDLSLVLMDELTRRE
jgi:hypothetical protein